VAHYPVFLDLRGRPCTVFGGGHLAEEKVRGLLAVEAEVTVIAPALTPELAALVEEGRLRHCPRGYQPGDLAGSCLVLSCEQTPDMAEAIWQEALERNVLINTLDDVPHCRFIAPSIVRRGDLAIAISTGGKAPVLAVRLRQWLESQLGDEYGRFLSLAGSVRAALARRWPDFATRRELWYRLIDSDVLDLLRRGDETAVARRFRDILDVELGVEPEAVREGEAA
jgi:precorrin-2 dehydrogenase / sirohydrochlorin ferrochelatase